MKQASDNNSVTNHNPADSSQNTNAGINPVLAILSIIANAASFEELWPGISRPLKDRFGIAAGSIILLDNGGMPARVIPLVDSYDCGFSDRAISSKPDHILQQFLSSGENTKVFEGSGIKDILQQPSPRLSSLLCVRLSANAKDVALFIAAKNKSSAFSPEDITTVQIITSQLALAIDRLQQISELRTVTTALESEIKERERADDTLKCIVEGTGAEIGTTFFKSVVQHMAEAVGARYAFVGELIDNGMTINTIAVWRSDGLINNFSYSVEGATGDACGDKICYCCQSVTKLMPDVQMQKMMRVQSCWGLPLNNSANTTVGVLVVMHDAPMQQEENIIPVMKIFAARSGPELERINMEADLFNEKERAQVTVESIGDGVITTNKQGIIDYINPVAERLTGWDNQQACGQSLKKVFNVIDTVSRAPVQNQIDCSQNGNVYIPVTDQVTLIRKDGEEFSVAHTMSPIFDRNNIIIGSVVTCRDISELSSLMSKMTYLANHDSLTGLVNRREFETRLQGLLETADFANKHHALCYLDLDNFKTVNDSCGHVAGDELLKQISKDILSLVRENDTVARLGGDEFAVLLQGSPLDNAEKIANKIRAIIKDKKFIWDGKLFDVGASIGVVAITNDSSGLSKILSTADAACYTAKERGRNTVYVHRQNDITLAREAGENRWVETIKTALQNDAFCLFHQKIVPLADNSNSREYFEILVRLATEKGHIIPPLALIPTAERHNLMPELDSYIINKTFLMLAEKIKTSHYQPGQCLINLSGQSLGDDQILARIVDSAKTHDITPNSICFEITEIDAIANITQARRFMTRLTNQGFSFALGDFGYGVNSFSYLKNLPVHYIKINGEIIKEVAKDEIDFTMVDTINRVGHIMGLKTIAEHVENEDILNILKDMGVDYAQGFGIEMPRPLLVESDTEHHADKIAFNKGSH